MSWIGVLKGVAYGDAWGDPHEFMSYEEIFTNGFPYNPAPELFVTDDTQMTLYLAEALEKESSSSREIESNIWEQFKAWYHDPDNDRSPGQTCMTSIANRINGVNQRNDSKGNGSLMRVWPCAYAKTNYSRINLSTLQSVTTHHNRTATNACNLAMDIIFMAENGALKPEHALAYAVAVTYLEDDKDLYNALNAAYKVKDKFIYDPFFADPCRFVGEGWVAEQALAIALLALSLPRKPISQLQWSVINGGDSDTIGAITGGFLGAFHGDIWPEEWLTRLEPRYAKWITKDWNLNAKAVY